MSSKVIDFSWYLNLSLCFWEGAGVGLLIPSPATPPRHPSYFWSGLTFKPVSPSWVLTGWFLYHWLAACLGFVESSSLWVRNKDRTLPSELASERFACSRFCLSELVGSVVMSQSLP